MRKICVITGSRAEFGILSNLIQQIENDDTLDLQLIATGSHLSPEFGYTLTEIEERFKVDKKIEILLSSDSPVGVSKSMGLTMLSFAEALQELEPDVVLVLGDRFEIFSAVSSALVLNIPVAHLHGGEVTEGAIDEAFRHSITKMSHLHFVSTETYRKRVIQLGESPDKVYNVGALGVENIKRIDLLSKSDLQTQLDLVFAEQNALITYHPTTVHDHAVDEVKALLSALDQFPQLGKVFTLSNADSEGRVINQLIQDYVAATPNAYAFQSLGMVRYFSMIAQVDVVIGNSSSGLIEVPSFSVPTVNIGDRQKGRAKAPSVIDCGVQSAAICDATQQALQAGRKVVKNPYEGGETAMNIVKVLRDVNLDNVTMKKFHDLSWVRQ